MKDLFEKESYDELIKLLVLRDIVVNKCNFHRNIPLRDSNTLSSLSVNLERGEVEPDFDADTLVVPVAYRVVVTYPEDKEKVILFFEVIYEVHFASTDIDRVKEILSADGLKEFFLGYQMDKFAWSYLRSSFSYACTATGIRALTLPMLQ